MDAALDWSRRDWERQEAEQQRRLLDLAAARQCAVCVAAPTVAPVPVPLITRGEQRRRALSADAATRRPWPGLKPLVRGFGSRFFFRLCVNGDDFVYDSRPFIRRRDRLPDIDDGVEILKFYRCNLLDLARPYPFWNFYLVAQR
jgi:hypothetical protein